MAKKSLPELPEIPENREESYVIEVVTNSDNSPSSYMDINGNKVVVLSNNNATAKIYAEVLTLREDVEAIKKLLK